MTIASMSDYRASLREQVAIKKLYSGQTLSATPWWTLWYSGGVPTNGASPADTTSGVVPTSATTGAPTISFGSGTGYLSRALCNGNVASGRMLLYDRLYHAGDFQCPTLYTLSAQPSYSARVPTYVGTQLWLEITSNWTLSPTVTITYTNQSGTPGQSTSVLIGGARASGYAYQVPLAAGDTGVQKIESTQTDSGLNAQTYTLVVARPLMYVPVNSLGAAAVDRPHLIGTTGMPTVYQASCLSLFWISNTASAPTLETIWEVASK